MAVPAIRECLDQAGGIRPTAMPLLLCVAEPMRPGRLTGLDDQLFRLICTELGVTFHEKSTTIPAGRVGGAKAMLLARKLIYEDRCPACIIIGVDSFLSWPTLAPYQSKSRLLTSQNSNGFIPGEAGCAVLVGPPKPGEANLVCIGIGEGLETATIESEEPLRGDGMVQALKAAMAEASVMLGAVDYRLADVSGEQYWFKEAALAVTRTLRTTKDCFDIWHPADCIGETGAAVGQCIFAAALCAARINYAPGRHALCHFSADGGERAAVILSFEAGGNN
jgi:3-oxoacyl-[acyl-carrier-protein] synthase-1